jgi:class 3 adenylate cyclase
MRADGTTETSSVPPIRAHGGVLRSHTADCVLATFDAPGQAIRCALALRNQAAADTPTLRIGIHTAEVDLAGEQIDGPSLSIAERVSRHAEAGEILVSRTIKDLVVGSEIKFADRGLHTLTADDEPWALFKVVRSLN